MSNREINSNRITKPFVALVPTNDTSSSSSSSSSNIPTLVAFLTDPCTGTQRQYLTCTTTANSTTTTTTTTTSPTGVKIYEVQSIPHTKHEAYSSFFVNSRVISNPQLHLVTPVDPLFFILAYFENQQDRQRQQQEAEKKWQPWDQIVTTKNIPKHILQALDMTQLGHLFSINNTLGDDLLLYKFNKDQALAWLQRKMDRISAFLEQQLVRSQDDACNVSPQTSYHHNQQQDETTGAFCSSFCMLPSRENLDTAKNVETKQRMMEEQHSKPMQVSPETEQQYGNHDANDDIHIVSSKDKLLIKRSAAQILCEYLPPYWQQEFLNSQGGMTLDDLIMATKPKNSNSSNNSKKDMEETTVLFDSTVSKSSSSCIQSATIHGMSEIDKLHQYTMGNVDGTGNGEGSSTSMLSKKRKEAEQSAGLKKLSKVNKKGMKTMTSFFNVVGKPKK